MAGKRRCARPLVAALFTSLITVLPGTGAAALPQFEQPAWSALTPEQRSILLPLAEDWPAMDAFRRKKWIGIAQRYPDMTPGEQASMQRNMRDWALLTPEERKAAREKFKTLKKAGPEKKQAVRQKWEEYQALSQEERDTLQARARSRPAAPKTPALLAPEQARSPISPLKSAPTLRVAPGATRPQPQR